MSALRFPPSLYTRVPTPIVPLALTSAATLAASDMDVINVSLVPEVSGTIRSSVASVFAQHVVIGHLQQRRGTSCGKRE